LEFQYLANMMLQVCLLMFQALSLQVMQQGEYQHLTFAYCEMFCSFLAP
jgi:hypothetical protein